MFNSSLTTIQSPEPIVDPIVDPMVKKGQLFVSPAPNEEYCRG